MTDSEETTAATLVRDTGGQPATSDGRRVLGVVLGKPVAGERKDPTTDDMVMVWPHLLVRHGVAALSALLLVLLISVFFDAPLRDVANPTVTPNPEKAPWYFAALQELLAHFHPLVAGVHVPTAIIVGLVAVPYVDRSPFIQPRHRRVRVHDLSRDLRDPDDQRLCLSRPELGLGLAVAGMARRAVARRSM